MSKTNNGGPAFPRVAHAKMSYEDLGSEGADPQQGMSLRDWFAGMAMQGILSQHHGDASGISPTFQTFPGDVEYQRRLTDAVYELADAMLESRK